MNTEHDPILADIRPPRSSRYIDYKRDRDAGKTYAMIALAYPQADSFERQYQAEWSDPATSAQIVVSFGSRIFGPFDSLRAAGNFVAQLPRPVDARFTYLSDPAEWEMLLNADKEHAHG